MRLAAFAGTLIWGLALAMPAVARPGFGIKSGGGTSSGSVGSSSGGGSRSGGGSASAGRSSGTARSGSWSGTGGRSEPRRQPGFGVNPNYRQGGGSSRGDRSRDRYFDGKGHDGGYRFPNTGFGSLGSRYDRGGRSTDRWRKYPHVSPFFFFGTPFYSPYVYPFDPLAPIYGYYDTTGRRSDEAVGRYDEDERAYGSRRGNVLLDIVPRDVEVRVDGVLTTRDGRAAINLPTGNYTIEVSRAGYQTWTTELVVRQGIRYQIEQRLERLPGQPEEPSGPAPRLVGELVLEVTPEDAIVNLDGRLLGVVNLLRDGAALRMIPVGRHMVEIRRPGYRTFAREIELNARDPLRLQVTLERE